MDMIFNLNMPDGDYTHINVMIKSPDGKCILVASSNKEVRVFYLPQNIAEREFNDENWLMGGWKNDIKPTFSYKESEYIYDYSWFPLMNAEDQNSCCCHLAYSVEFSLDGLKLIGGYLKRIQVFDVERPGKISAPIISQEHTGIVSAISCHPQLRSVIAAGSYSSSLALFSLQTQRPFVILQGQKKGITHIKFSGDGTKLFSGTRNDDDIFCWDMRNPGELLAVYKRELTTNQKYYFDVTPQDDRFLITGTKRGQVLVYDLSSSSSNTDQGDILPTTSFTAHKDCVNGISVHPNLPLLATSSGQRSIPQVDDVASSDSDDSESETSLNTTELKENSMKLWWIGQFQ
ncbi:Telomerase Cajal body protein 1 [Armadillidium vulgare]|nr:Telomerase Cajal body protein 1 [Armadillidium vulgare]